MNYLICENCGYSASVDEIGTQESYLCTLEGHDYYERVTNTCPHCNGEFLDAVECKICGSLHRADEDGWFGYCEECLDKEANFDIATDIGRDNKESVMVNGLITHMFSAEEIEAILLDYAKNHQDRERNGKTYCLDDTICFTDYLDDKCK